MVALVHRDRFDLGNDLLREAGDPKRGLGQFMSRSSSDLTRSVQFQAVPTVRCRRSMTRGRVSRRESQRRSDSWSIGAARSLISNGHVAGLWCSIMTPPSRAPESAHHPRKFGGVGAKGSNRCGIQQKLRRHVIVRADTKAVGEHPWTATNPDPRIQH